MSHDASKSSILILGLGELGTAIVSAILNHPSYNPSTTPITIMVRASTLDTVSQSPNSLLNSTTATTTGSSSNKTDQIQTLMNQKVSFIPGDLQSQDEQSLTKIFTPYTTIIHAGSMTLQPGTQLKITKAVLATNTVSLYIPWQFGVDYDKITRQGGQGMFTEQLDVRDLLRHHESQCKWLIISCGIFMSFLFEPFWGVVKFNDHATKRSEVKVEKVQALGSWSDLLTTTTAEDIGRCTAELLLVDTQMRNRSVYIAGESLTYAAFADLLEYHFFTDCTGRGDGKRMERELWSTDHLRQDSERDPGNQLKKYRVVFSEGKGLAWSKTGSHNDLKDMRMVGVVEYLKNRHAAAT